MTLKYLLDENLPPIYRSQLAHHQPDLIAWMIGDPGVPAKGTKDPEILVWCEENEFILVTNNRKSMPVHLADHLSQGRHIPGILAFRRNAKVGDIIEDLILIADTATKEEFQDQIVYVPL
jgi:predicted nuclease of predicted toxin-antitoxin system